jgi:hypothetical protein
MKPIIEDVVNNWPEEFGSYRGFGTFVIPNIRKACYQKYIETL